MNSEFDVIVRIKELCTEHNMSYYRLSKLFCMHMDVLKNK